MPTEQSTAAVQRIVDDQSKALRAPKDTDGKIGIDDPRTAVRHIQGDEFQVVSTRIKSFPEGTDMVDTHDRETVEKWVEAQDPDLIEVEQEDGFKEVC